MLVGAYLELISREALSSCSEQFVVREFWCNQGGKRDWVLLTLPCSPVLCNSTMLSKVSFCVPSKRPFHWPFKPLPSLYCQSHLSMHCQISSLSYSRKPQVLLHCLELIPAKNTQIAWKLQPHNGQYPYFHHAPDTLTLVRVPKKGKEMVRTQVPSQTLSECLIKLHLRYHLFYLQVIWREQGKAWSFWVVIVSWVAAHIPECFYFV